MQAGFGWRGRRLGSLLELGIGASVIARVVSLLTAKPRILSYSHVTATAQ